MKNLLLLITLIASQSALAESCSPCIEDQGSNPPTAFYNVLNGGYDDLTDVVMTGSLKTCEMIRSQDLRCQSSTTKDSSQ
jgi:hypothetical protein